MALISCPECGKKVSDMAKTCPDCGYPIASMNPSGTVTIKICNGLAKTVYIFRPDNLEVLWEGKAGQVATFSVTEETTIGIVWGIVKPHPKPDIKETVKGGDKLSLEARHGFLGMVSYVLNRVDVIDSGF